MRKVPSNARREHEMQRVIRLVGNCATLNPLYIPFYESRRSPIVIEVDHSSDSIKKIHMIARFVGVGLENVQHLAGRHVAVHQFSFFLHVKELET